MPCIVTLVFKYIIINIYIQLNQSSDRPRTSIKALRYAGDASDSPDTVTVSGYVDVTFLPSIRIRAMVSVKKSIAPRILAGSPMT